MRYVFTAATVFAALSGCSGSESQTIVPTDEVEVASDSSESSSVDVPTAAMAAAATSAQQSAAVSCRSFKSRENETGTLHGIAIGDTIEQVTQQLTCTPNPHTLEFSYERGIGPVIEMPNGQRGVKFILGKRRGPLKRQSVRVHFVGLPGSERVFGISGSGSFEGNEMPSLEQFSNALLRQNPSAQRYGPGVGSNASDTTRIGYSSTADGRRILDHNATMFIAVCADMNLLRSGCGLSYEVVLVSPFDNSNVVKTFHATLVDWPYVIPRMEAAEIAMGSAMRDAKEQRNQDQRRAAEQNNKQNGL